MSLRDELVEQKRKEEARKAAATPHPATKRDAKKRAEEAARRSDADAAVRFDELKANLAAGNLPEDWLTLYEKYVEKIKKALSGAAREDFSFVDTVSKEFYEEKARIHRGKTSEVTLLNRFITQKLKDEGFKNVAFELRKRTERYATKEDYEQQTRKQEGYDAQAHAKYMEDLSRYNNGGYEYMAAPNSTDGAYRPRQASLSMSGVRHHYEIVVRGGLYKFSEKKRKKSEGLSAFSISMPVVLGILGFIGGFYFYMKGGFLGKDIGPLAPFLVAVLGALIGLTVVGMEKGIRMAHLAAADHRVVGRKKAKSILIGLALLVLALAALVVLVGIVVYAVKLTL